jgi:HPt (histidine-containing phosphotransfer) domain-containing protein
MRVMMAPHRNPPTPGCTDLPKSASLDHVFNEAEISLLFDDDAESILELLTLVTTDLPKYAAALIGHVERAEWADVGRLAHTIKGAAANVFAPQVAAIAQAVERAAKESRFESIPDDAHTLTSAVTALVQALEEWAARLASRREVA